MLTATVPCGGGGLPSSTVTEAGTGVVGLLDVASGASSAAGQNLPCSANPDLWFGESPRELEKAKALCAHCPVRAVCLEGALSRREPCGVWGGEIFERGIVIARKRPRGRPPKSALPATANNRETVA